LFDQTRLLDPQICCRRIAWYDTDRNALCTWQPLKANFYKRSIREAGA